MKHPILPALALLLVFLGSARPAMAAREGSAISLSATLILASDQPGETDNRLRAYEATLRRIFSFQNYRQIGRASTTITAPGNGSLNLGGGQELRIELPGQDSSSIRAEVNWRRDGRTLIHTTVSMKPGVPTLLGGPNVKGGKGNLIVVLVAN